MMRWLPTLMLLSLVASAPAADPPEVMQFFEFGPTWPGAVVTHVFSFTNDTPSLWRISGLQQSCSCGLVEKLPDQVGPGATLVMTVHQAIGEQRNRDLGGRVSVLATSADGSARRLVCSFAVRVRGLLMLPAGGRVVLAPLQPGGAPVTTTVRVKRGTHPAPWETLTARVVAGKESLSTQVRPVEGDPDSWDIDLIATAGSLSGVIPGRVEFVATAGGVPLPFSESLTVIARVQGTARADPSSLLFGTVPLGQRTAMDVDVLAEENQEKPQITGATVSDPERCSVVVGANGRITVTLTGKPSATKSPQASGHVDIHLARGTDLRVPYFAALAQP